MIEYNELGHGTLLHKMSDSGGTEEDLGFYSDMISPMKSAKSSVDSPASIEKPSDQPSKSSSPLLDTQPLPADDLAICPYCNKNFRKPRVLDCLHSMCEDCIIAQLDGRNDGKREMTDFELEQAVPTRPTPPGVIRCPICSQESNVGNDVRFVNAMLLDFVRLRQIAEQDGEKGERICRACKGEQPAIANCHHCCSDLCKNCVQAHCDMRMFDGHKVVLFSDIQMDPLKDETSVELALCAAHQVPYDQVCSHCDELICKNCMSDHQDHICTPINDQVYHYCKSKIAHIVDELEYKGQLTADARSAIPRRLSELSTTYDRCRNKIDRSFQTFVELLECIKEQVISDLNKKRDEQEEYYNNMYNKIDQRMSMMQDALDFTNRLLEKGTKVELCASRKKIYQQLLLLHRSMPDMNNEFDIDFETLPIPELHKKFESIIGTVQCRVTALASKDIKALSGNLVSTDDFQLCSDRLNNISTKSKHLPPASTWNFTMDNLSCMLSGQNLGKPSAGTPLSATATATNGFSAGPGTIGMERRRMTNSQDSASSSNNGYMSGGGAFFSMFSGDYSGGLLQQHPSASIDGNAAAHGAPDMFNVNRLSLDSYVPGNIGRAAGNLPSTNSFNSLDLSINLANAFQDPFNQNKIWGSNSNSAFGTFNLDNRAKALIDQRYGADLGAVALSGLDVPSFLQRSSQCTTPAFDNAFSMAGSSSNYNTAPVRNSMLDMTLSSMFGATGMDALNTPQGLAVGLDDEVAIADTNNHRCIVMNTSGKTMRILGGSGTEDGSFYFPKKIVSLIRGNDNRFIVLDRGTTQLFNRLQLFRNNGDFICRLFPGSLPFHFEQVNVLAVNKDNEQLIIIDNKNNVMAFSLEMVPQIRFVSGFNITGFVHEASDVAVHKGIYYITDYKTHAVVAYSSEGKFLQKFGSNTLTPYPVGIDITKSGDILVGDSHGNHFHVVLFNTSGVVQQEYKCVTQKVSRCTGLKMTSNGCLITMSRQNRSGSFPPQSLVLVFNTLYMSPTM